MPSWIEKQARAKSLVDDVKKMNAEGIDSGEKASTAHSKMAEVQTLMTEVKAEKLEEQKSQLVDLLSRYETTEPEAPRPSTPVGLPVSTQAADTQTNTYGDRLVMSAKAMGQLQLEGKALGEATQGAGGYLVPPSYLQNMFAETRRQGNSLRRYGWLASHPVTSNQVLLPKGSGTATVGIVAEGAVKPSADQTFTQVAVNIFVFAGISKISNQLLQDSSPTAVDLVTRELGTLLGNLEEQKIISGSGTGEPRGILNTTGVNAVTVTATTAQDTIDAILDAIVAIQTTYFASPTGVLMHPRRLAKLSKGKTTDTGYLFNPAGSFHAPSTLYSGSGVTSQSTGTTMTMPTLLGLPVGVSTNIPTNGGAGTNQDSVIVGDWNEAHWFSRQDQTLDVSDSAGTAFETNSTWFRLEERAGFSAERYPQAFAVVSGAGLVP